MTYHSTKFRLLTISQTLAMDDFVELVSLNILGKYRARVEIPGILNLNIEYKMGNGCKFNVAVFKIQNINLQVL